MNKIIYTLFLLVLIACKKEEIPVEKHIPGDAVINSFDMGSDYRTQTFFDLKTNSIVSTNLKTIWDLGFQSGVNGNKIILNSSNAMTAARVINASFNSITDTVGLDFMWDAPSGNLDSTSFGDLEINNVVYVIDRGKDYLGNHRGVCKLVIISITNTSYTFRVANLDGSFNEQVTLLKNEEISFTPFSLTSRAEVSVYPPKTDWDLQFTQYYHYFDYFLGLGIEDEAYLVAGVLTNRFEVQVAEVFNKDFNEISNDDVSKLDFSSNIDVIGFDWKEFNFTSGVYSIYSNKNYVIKSTEGIFFKLRFIDFYNDQGDKGTPVFEVQEL